MDSEPLLFHMRWRGYDPAEVTECYLTMTQCFEAYARTMEAEKETISIENLKLTDRVEEEKECRKKLQELLEAERRENVRLRSALTMAAPKDATVSGAAGAEAAGSSDGLPVKEFRSDF